MCGPARTIDHFWFCPALALRHHRIITIDGKVLVYTHCVSEPTAFDLNNNFYDWEDYYEDIEKHHRNMGNGGVYLGAFHVNWDTHTHLN